MSETTFEGVRREIDAAENGLHSSTLTFRLNKDGKAILSALNKLKREGFADCISEPDGVCMRRNLWFRADRRSHCQAIVKARKATKCTNPKAIGDWPGTARPIVLGPAARVHVAEPEKFFRRDGYTPDMLHTGSAIARAYGERQA